MFAPALTREERTLRSQHLGGNRQKGVGKRPAILLDGAD